MSIATRGLRFLPATITLLIAAALLLHGPIAQDPAYHRFADGRAALGIPNAADVLSNLPFALVGLWGLLALARDGRQRFDMAWPGYRSFLAALVLIAMGSAYYHLAPDNGTLLWDRLPIALACAGLLSAVYAETHERTPPWLNAALAGAAVASVLWWWLTERSGAGDLRPYALVQGLPVILIPLWQHLHGCARADRLAFGAAIVLFVASKAAEVGDAAIFEATGVASGHTLKHLLAAAAAGIVTARIATRPDTR